MLDWLGDNLGNLVSTGLQGYGLYSQNQAQDKYYNTLQQANADKQALADEQYQYDLAVSQLMSGGSGGGGGGSSAPKFDQNMLNVYKDYMGKAEAQYTPWIEGAKSLLPKANSAYGTGLGIAEQMAKMYSTPEALQRMNQSVPSYSIGLDIYGKK